MENEKKNTKEKETQEIEDDNFLSRYYLQPEEMYSKERYLTVIMRFSIFERILTKYLFQSASKEFTLYPYLEDVQSDDKLNELLKSRMNFCSKKFDKDSPIFFWGNIKRNHKTIKRG